MNVQKAQHGSRPAILCCRTRGENPLLFSQVEVLSSVTTYSCSSASAIPIVSFSAPGIRLIQLSSDGPLACRPHSFLPFVAGQGTLPDNLDIRRIYVVLIDPSKFPQRVLDSGAPADDMYRHNTVDL